MKLLALVAGAAGFGSSPLELLSTAEPSTCAITGFETFCEHWAACTQPPATAMVSDDGRCLYSRMGWLDTSKTVLDQDVGGEYQKVTFVSGPDHVSKLATLHCSAEGRGKATLGVGWTNPSTTDGYWYVVFAAPCASGPAQDLAAVFDSDTSTALFTDASWEEVAASGWGGTPRPVPASWPGVAAVASAVMRVRAPVSVWVEMARKYSFVGGGLGPAGKINSGSFFLEVCQFGDYAHAGCCANGVGDASFLALAAAFSEAEVASGTTDVAFASAAALRAWLSNNLDCAPFYNGDGFTYDGCYGFYTVLSSTEYLLPNKHFAAWDTYDDSFKVSELVAGRQGLAFSWGPPDVCATAQEGACDYNDGTIIDQASCEAQFGPLPAAMAAPVYGSNATEVCARPSLYE